MGVGKEIKSSKSFLKKVESNGCSFSAMESFAALKTEKAGTGAGTSMLGMYA